MQRPLPVFVVLLCQSLAAAGCLPRGEPPAGRQILADPTASLLSITPLHADGTRQVLFFRPSQAQDPDSVDLWSLTLAASGEPSTENVLARGIAVGLQLSYRAGGGSGFPMDAAGRIYLPDNDSGHLVRYDPATGEKKDRGTNDSPALSPSGRRLLTSDHAGNYTLYEDDDQATTFQGSHVEFIGESVFYVSADCQLMRLAEGGGPEVFAPGVQTYQVAWGSLIALQHTTALSCFTGGGLDGPLSHPVLLDTTTRQETPLPDDLQYDFSNFSSDGRRLTARRYDQDDQAQWFIVDRASGNLESLGTGIGFADWRPGHDELWLGSFDDSRPELQGASVTIWIPGQGPHATVPGVYLSGFNSDGRYWFSRGTRPDQLITSDLVGLADQPGGARYHAVPVGSTMGDVVTLGDGRLFVGSVTDVNDFRATDYLVVDPRDGATDVLGLRGFIAATGTTRLLGIFNYAYERGDLTTVDFATGRRTILVSQFVMAAIPAASSDDAFPANTSVFYQFRARYDSPWSGLWMMAVP